MATAPNTVGILTAIHALIAGLQLNSTAAFITVKVGTVKQLTNDLLPLCEINGEDDSTERVSIARVGDTLYINDTQLFLVTSTVAEDDSTDSMVLLAQLRDLVTQLFHASASLNGVDGVKGVYIEGNGKYGFSFRNGVWRRLHQIPVKVWFEYTTTLEQ